MVGSEPAACPAPGPPRRRCEYSPLMTERAAVAVHGSTALAERIRRVVAVQPDPALEPAAARRLRGRGGGRGAPAAAGGGARPPPAAGPPPARGRLAGP